MLKYHLPDDRQDGISPCQGRVQSFNSSPWQGGGWEGVTMDVATMIFTHVYLRIKNANTELFIGKNFPA